MWKREIEKKLPAIIISGMAGVGKSTLAKMLADHYNIEYVCGGDILKEIAREEGYNPTENWWETKEGMEFLKKRQQDPEYDRKLDALLIERAKKGNCAITSWALPWIWEGGIKIWLHASQEKRAERIARRDGISFEEAMNYVKKRDIENVKLYNKLYGFELGKDLDVFDIIMNVESMTPEDMLKNTVEVLESKFNFKK